MYPSIRVFLPQLIEKEAMKLLEEAGYEIVVSPDLKPETILPLMKGVRGMVLRTGLTMTRELMSKANDLWVISRTGAGVDNVDVSAATEMGIVVTSVPGANTRTVAEHTLALILTLFKKIPLMDREVRRDNFGIRLKNLPHDLSWKTLGLVGLGRIGAEIARICHQGFEMRILAHDPYLTRESRINFEGWVELCDMEKVFRESNVISLHLPLTPVTAKLIGSRELGWMKPDAFLVNTSRGGVLDEAALIRCLKDRKIAGAGLDVFAQEPLEEDNALKQLDNVILTPHTAALTHECVVRLAVGAVQAAIAILQGRKPEGGAYIVNPEVLTQSRWLETPLA